MGENELAEALKGAIFRVPTATGEQPVWQPADEYLSGNVRAKLRIAELTAASDPSYIPNIEALRCAQPPDLGAAEISVRLGATWIPADDVREFVLHLLDPPYWVREQVAVRYSAATAQWRIEGKGRDGSNVRALSTYGTRRMSAYHIIEETLNLKDARVVDYVEDENGKKKPVLNKKETAVALAKQEAIKAAFKEWVFSDQARRRGWSPPTTSGSTPSARASSTARTWRFRHEPRDRAEAAPEKRRRPHPLREKRASPTRWERARHSPWRRPPWNCGA
ncbi:MAG: hypothetical protein ACLSDQ_00835 [Adlercreutzia equolifaciens]